MLHHHVSSALALIHLGVAKQKRFTNVKHEIATAFGLQQAASGALCSD